MVFLCDDCFVQQTSPSVCHRRSFHGEFLHVATFSIGFLPLAFVFLCRFRDHRFDSTWFEQFAISFPYRFNKISANSRRGRRKINVYLYVYTCVSKAGKKNTLCFREYVDKIRESRMVSSDIFFVNRHWGIQLLSR